MDAHPGHIAHPQRAHTDTKKMSSLSVPENRLPNAVLSEKKKKKQIHKVCSPLLFTPGCGSRGMDRGREEQQCPRKWVQDGVYHTHRRGPVPSHGASAPLPLP